MKIRVSEAALGQAISLALVIFMLNPAAQAQDRSAGLEPRVVVDPQTGRTSETTAGRAGQRQTREKSVEHIGIDPMARQNSRISNRVQSRLRNRIDRNYAPRANASSAFDEASDQIRPTPRAR